MSGPERPSALISGNFDDSQSTGDVWTIAGYIGYSAQWDHFERLWNEALARHGVPYFHMKEMADPSGPFAKWLPPRNQSDEVAAYFKDLVAAIKKCGLYMVASTVWLKDLERFNREVGVGLQAYPLAAHACLSMIAEKFTAYTREKTGEDPQIRKSLDALISGDPKTMRTIVWDYVQLMDTHKARRGVWV